ncbi:MAG: hypothetical protein Q4C01_00870, partial [Clostridia bacterium]|nr:hypothetical protein [Clostridia bacterium]
MLVMTIKDRKIIKQTEKIELHSRLEFPIFDSYKKSNPPKPEEICGVWGIFAKKTACKKCTM